jgi:hypothetical protein
MLKEVFTELRKGRHIGPEDDVLYGALAGHKDDFQNLFGGLGLDLVFHDRGFFYLDDESSPRTAQRMVLFAAILVEQLDDQGCNLDLELTSVPIHPAALPHLKHEKYAKVMAEVDVTTEEALLKVLDSMKRYGLAAPAADGSWRLRTAAYRLLDIMNLAGRAIRGEGEAAELAEPLGETS